MRGQQRGRRLFGWSAGALVVVAAIAGIVSFSGSASARAEIDGMVLTDAEIAISTDRTVRGVEQAGGDEAEVHAQAIDALRDDMSLLQLARELGATQLERPSDILDALDDVNAARSDAQRAGEVIYGPVEYSARTFYAKTLADVREATIQAMRLSDDDRFLIADADVRARFDQEPGEWASAATTLTLSRIWTPEPDPATAQAVLSDALQTGNPTGLPGETLTVSDAELVNGAWNPDTVAAIRAQDVGGLAGPEPSASGWAMYRVDSRDVDAEAAFERYRESIRSLLLDERLISTLSAIKADQDVSD